MRLYMPHNAVFKELNTTKNTVMLDGSAEITTGISPNDTLSFFDNIDIALLASVSIEVRQKDSRHWKVLNLSNLIC